MEIYSNIIFIIASCVVFYVMVKEPPVRFNVNIMWMSFINILLNVALVIGFIIAEISKG